jgi:hypothetical protein
MCVMRSKRWVALGATMTLLLTASLAFGEDPTPCYEAYRTGHLTGQQVSFEEFRERYEDDVCATDDPSMREAGADPQDLPGVTRK